MKKCIFCNGTGLGEWCFDECEVCYGEGYVEEQNENTQPDYKSEDKEFENGKEDKM